jgi:hypothetical protein
MRPVAAAAVAAGTSASGRLPTRCASPVSAPATPQQQAFPSSSSPATFRSEARSTTTSSGESDPGGPPLSGRYSPSGLTGGTDLHRVRGWSERRPRTVGTDLAFRAPRSVSLLFVLGDRSILSVGSLL